MALIVRFFWIATVRVFLPTLLTDVNIHFLLPNQLSKRLGHTELFFSHLDLLLGEYALLLPVFTVFAACGPKPVRPKKVVCLELPERVWLFLTIHPKLFIPLAVNFFCWKWKISAKKILPLSHINKNILIYMNSVSKPFLGSFGSEWHTLLSL